ncbi:MAG TPA: DUF2946 family protein [bacterium]|jgi:hypothetical protein|nr:DUF2946 family protein [bacterium]
MKFFRKYLFSFATFAFLAFVSVLAIEGAHHHDNLENHDDCSLCAWQMTGSSAPYTPTPPLLFHAVIFITLFVFTPFAFSSFVSFSTSGRAPPSILL